MLTTMATNQLLKKNDEDYIYVLISKINPNEAPKMHLNPCIQLELHVI